MAYREETEGLQRRVEQLEGELADAHRTIAAHEARIAADRRAREVTWLTGVPDRLVVSRKVLARPTAEAFAEIADLWSSRVPGQPTQDAGTLSHRARGLEMTVATDPDGTSATLGLVRSATDVYLATTVFTVGFAVGFTVLFAALERALETSFSLAVSLPLILLAAFFAARALVRRDQQATQARCVRAVDAAADLVMKYAPRTRVATPAVTAPARAPDVVEEEPASAENVASRSA